MSQKVECRLPSINSLALDFPLMLPQPVYGQNNHNPHHYHLHGVSSPQINAMTYGTQGKPSANIFNHYANPVSAAEVQNSIYHNSSVLDRDISGAQGYFPLHNSNLAGYTLSQPKPIAPLAINNPFSGTLVARKSVVSLSDSSIQQPSPTSSCKSSSPPLITYDNVSPPKIQTTPKADPRISSTTVSSNSSTMPSTISPAFTSTMSSSSVIPQKSVYESAEASRSPDSTKELKRRRKRQCPECHLFFSNLATHKSTHLNPTARPHTCNVCNRGFARPNDLFRHYKCHWKETGTGSGQFRCPFKFGGHKYHCSHSSGIFSRCDTYKNHLKAIHFDYPGGTRKADRSTTSGRCGSCQEQFSSVDEWLSTHVDTYSCKFMGELNKE